ncbi:tandem-95 repeat protein, partial [bacterium]|nr:tandem-95 repeat protein [bacterium]
IVVTGVAPNCNVVVTPALNQNGGPVTVTLTVTDTGTPMPVANNTTTFDVTVNAVNDAPTITGISNQTVNEDTATGALTFTIGDVETGGALTCAGSVVGASSNTTIIPNGNIVVTGVAPNCNVVVTPALNQNGGPVTITLTVTDSGTPMPVANNTTTFDVTVTAINDAPTITGISNQTVNEDTATGALTFTIGDVETGGALTCAGSVVGTSSNTTVIPNGNIVVTGVAPNCNVVVTPALNQNGGPVTVTLTVTDTGTPMPVANNTTTFDVTVTPINDIPTISGIANQTVNEDTATGSLAFTIGDIETGGALTCAGSVVGTSSNTTIIPNGNIVVTGVAPNCNVVVTPALNQNGGPVTVTLTVTDTGTPMPVANNNTTFDVTVTPINDIPTISGIANQTVNEDIATGALTFTIGDVETGGALTCAGSVVGTSSNTTIIPNGNIVVTGVAPNCNVVVTPALNQNGGPVTVTLTVTDSGTPMPVANNTTTFNVTVNAVNDDPVITIITAGPYVTNEDNSIAINFDITDVDNTLNCVTSMTQNTSTPAVIAVSGIVFSGTAPNCTATITPELNQSGSANLVFRVTDAAAAFADTSALTVTVNAVNDAPTISSISDQSINEDNPSAAIPFTIGDVDNVLICSSANISVNSSNVGLISNASVVIGGSFPNCTVTVTPSLNQSGLSTITLTLNDNGVPNLQAVETFDVTVNAVNDIPTISSIANQTINEDLATGSLAFTIGDIETGGALTCAGSVVGTSSNTTIIPNGNIVVTGVAPNCNVVVTPAANQNGGPVTITLTVTDSGTPLPVANNNTTFDVTVSAVDDPPVINPISAQVTNKNTAIAVSFTISDIDSVLNCSSSMAMSSTNTTLVPNTNVVFSGAVPNCTATITPANLQFGVTDITLTVSDGTSPDSETFQLTVNNVDLPPTISTLTNRTVNEDGTAVASPNQNPLAGVIPFVVNFTIDDVDSGLNCVTSMQANSSNAAVVPNGNVVFGGTYPNCTATITLVANSNTTANGATSIAFEVHDATTTVSSNAFTLTVTAVNDRPTVTGATNQSTNEDTPITVFYTINDIDSVINCTTSITVNIPAPAPTVTAVKAGTYPNCQATFTPAANAFGGPKNITFIANDGLATGQQSFQLTILAVNDAPTISAIPPTSFPSGVPTDVAFTIGDVEAPSPNCTTSMSASTSNPAVIPLGNIVFSGNPSYPNCKATVTAATTGTSDLIFTVTDSGGLPTSSSPSTMTSLTAGSITVSQSLSTVTVTANSSIASNKAFAMPSEVVTITVTARDTNNMVLGGGHWVVIQKAGGTSDGILSAVTDNNDGTYTATFSGTVAGSARTFNAFIDGYPLASALPTVTVGSRGPNCLSYKNAGYVIDGIYALDTDGDVGGNAPFNAYCDMTTNGGGWTLAAVPRKGVIPFAEASGLLSPATVADSRNTNIWFAASSFEFSQMRLTSDATATQFSIADFKESKSIANLLSTYSVYSQSNVVLGSASANSSVVSNIGSTCFVVRGKSAASAPWADSADYMFMGFHGGAGCSVPINSGNNWDRTNITQQWLISGYDGLDTVDGPEQTNSNVGQNLTGTDWVSQDSATLIWLK